MLVKVATSDKRLLEVTQFTYVLPGPIVISHLGLLQFLNAYLYLVPKL